jgi:hypothetical protein
MTPEPADLLRGARRTLAEVVLPALRDRFATEQLKTVLGLLAHLEAVVDEAYPLESAEAEDLRRFLGAAARSDDPALAPLRGALAAEAAEPAAEDGLPSYRALREKNVRCKALVTGVIRALGLPAGFPTERRAIEEALDGLVRRQLARERRWTRPARSTK